MSSRKGLGRTNTERKISMHATHRVLASFSLLLNLTVFFRIHLEVHLPTNGLHARVTLEFKLRIDRLEIANLDN